MAALFAQRDESLYLVGGPVRDAMLGRLGNDLDFTTSARPEVIAEILGIWGEKTWDTGIEFGTVSSIKRGQQVEITTFRSDLYDGVTRNPEVTFGDTLEGDLVRRDFACNAMAIELSLVDATLTPTFHDPVGGLDDLLARRLDTPQAPEISFRDVLQQNLQVMDAQAIHHCMEHRIPIIVFNMKEPGHIAQVINGQAHGTKVTLA